MPFPAVLFDSDGTLVDSEFLHIQAWLQAFDRIGHPVDAARIHRAVGLDTVWDGASAAQAGIRFAGVRSGGIREAELRGAGAVEVWADPAELLSELDRSMLGRPPA